MCVNPQNFACGAHLGNDVGCWGTPGTGNPGTESAPAGDPGTGASDPGTELFPHAGPRDGGPRDRIAR